MKTTIKKAMQLLMLLSMLLPAIPCFASQNSGTISTATKDAVVASTPRILVMGVGAIVDASNGDVIRPAIGPIATGSGFLIYKNERDGFVLTNAHVLVEEKKPTESWEEDGKKVCFLPAQVYYLAFFHNGANDPRIYVAQEVVCKDLNRGDNTIDLAVLRISSDSLPEPLRIDPRELDETQPVVAVGYPGNFDRLNNFLKANTTQNPLIAEIISKLDNFSNTYGYITVRLNVSDRDFVNPAISMGNIIRYDETPGKPQRVIHSAPIGQGNSGGPLVDPSTGYVVGINTWKPTEVAGSIAQSSATMIGYFNSNNIPYLLPEGVNLWLVGGIAGGALLLIILIIILANSGGNDPAITLYTEGQSFPLTLKQLKKGVLLGRSSSADVSVPQKTVSARHARIFVRDDRLYIEDIGSKGGTKVNGTALTPHSPAPFHPGSTIMLCNIEVRVR